MNRKEFISVVSGLAIVPSIINAPGRLFRVPRTFAVCFGKSGSRIWSHLVKYNTSRELLPMIVETEKSIPRLLRPLGQKMVTIISRLDDPLLTKTLPMLGLSQKAPSVSVTGYFIYPSAGVDDLSSAVIANCNLRRAYDVMKYARVVNLPDYDNERPHWPLQFYDDKMTDPEKQIVWEILRSEQQTITKHKKGATL